MIRQSGEIPRGIFFGLSLACALSLLGGASTAASQDRPASRAVTQFLSTALSFEANVGQIEAPVKYMSRGPGYGLFLTPAEAVLVLQRLEEPSQSDSPSVSADTPRTTVREATLRLQFVGTDKQAPQPLGRDRLAAKTHYFLGNNPTEWRTDVPHYGQVVYESLYPGIDLVYYGRGGQLEYDLVVAPGANPDAIELQFQGIDQITLTPDGALRLKTAVGNVLQHQPVIYQELNGVRHEISGSYRLKNGNRVSFDIAAYDTTQSLYIDPVLSYASYIESDGLYSLARDRDGNLYLTGAAFPSLPTVNALQSSHRGFRDAFVAKLDPTGTTLLYSTYLGGSLDDFGRDIAVDESGQAYLVGISSSADFPTANPIQQQNAGSYDVFVAMLSPSGASLKYSTYLGGSGEDGLLRGLALDVDSQGNAYLTGTTNSSDFPTLTTLQPAYAGAVDAFIAKIGGAGPGLLFSSYLGGTNSDYGGDLAVDASDQVYVVGTTFSEDFPTLNAMQPSLGGERDIFVTTLTSDGAAFRYSTYLGGRAQDEGNGVAVNAEGEAFITGHTQSSDYPTVNPAQSNLGGRADVVISHLDAAGASLLSSTYVGGNSQDKGLDITIDENSRVYVTGSTFSKDFPITSNAAQSIQGMGGMDAFVLKLSASGTSILYGSYLGGNGNDVGQAISVDALENTYIAGTTASSDLPRTAPLQATPSGGFLAQLSGNAPGLANLTITMGESAEPVERGKPLTYTITVTNEGPDIATGVMVTDKLPARLRVTAISSSQGNCQGEPVVCELGSLGSGTQATVTITGTPLAAPWILENRASVFSELPDPTGSNNSMKLSTEVTVPNEGPEADLSLINNDDTDPATIGTPFRYTLTVSNNGPDTAPDIILTETIPPDVSLGALTPSQGTCTGKRELICQLNSLKVGAEATVTIEVIPTTVTTLRSQALVTSGATDPIFDNSSDIEATLVNVVPQASDLSLTARPDDTPVTANSSGEGVVQWRFTIFNGGGQLATDVKLTGTLPAPATKLRNLTPNKEGEETDEEGEEVNTVNCVPLDCFSPEECQDVLLGGGFGVDDILPIFTEDNALFTCEVGNLDVGLKVTVDVAVALPPGTHTVQGSVTTTAGDPIPSNNQASSEATVVEQPPDPPASSGGDGGGCFIATAAFGSPLTKEVKVLRHFRDRYLLPYQAGQLLVRGYYYTSPPLAAFIAQHSGLKQMVRLALWPVVWWAHMTLEAPFLALAVLLGWGMMMFGGLYWLFKYWKRQNRYDLEEG